jgi:hypothetical protein
LLLEQEVLQFSKSNQQFIRKYNPPADNEQNQGATRKQKCFETQGASKFWRFSGVSSLVRFEAGIFQMPNTCILVSVFNRFRKAFLTMSFE